MICAALTVVTTKMFFWLVSLPHARCRLVPWISDYLHFLSFDKMLPLYASVAAPAEPGGRPVLGQVVVVALVESHKCAERGVRRI